MLTLNDFSLLLVTPGKDINRLRAVYTTIRNLYPTNEIVIVYDNNLIATLDVVDENLIEVHTDKRVYVSGGYNLALTHATRKCFVILHDDTFPAENFLENIIPHVTETQFCNFTTVEPPLYNDPDTLMKPIKDFGRSVELFNWNEFNTYTQLHINKLTDVVVPSPFGGFFMAGYINSLNQIGKFDEQFQPYFYEDADLILRMHMSGYNFVHSLNSIVYHMGSLTSRASNESNVAMQTTSNIFLSKWKCPWEYIRKYTLEHLIEYKKISFEIQARNCPIDMQNYFKLISDTGSNIKISIDGEKLNQNDVEYLQTLPYVLSSLEEYGTYEIGNLTVHYTQD
jgi:GT2 family glycosyltransferase